VPKTARERSVAAGRQVLAALRSVDIEYSAGDAMRAIGFADRVNQ
jgi:hypothetical protein